MNLFGDEWKLNLVTSGLRHQVKSLRSSSQYTERRAFFFFLSLPTVIFLFLCMFLRLSQSLRLFISTLFSVAIFPFLSFLLRLPLPLSFFLCISLFSNSCFLSFPYYASPFIFFFIIFSFFPFHSLFCLSVSLFPSTVFLIFWLLLTHSSISFFFFFFYLFQLSFFYFFFLHRRPLVFNSYFFLLSLDSIFSFLLLSLLFYSNLANRSVFPNAHSSTSYLNFVLLSSNIFD